MKIYENMKLKCWNGWNHIIYLTHTHTHKSSATTYHFRENRILLKWQGSKQGKKRKEKEILRMMFYLHFLKQASAHDDALKCISTSVIWPGS